MPEVELPNIEELAEARGKRFTKRVALTTAIFAVILAISSLGGSNAMKEMLLAQQQASDQWAFYQSKVVRQQLHNLEKTRMELELLRSGPSMTPQVREKYEATLKNISDEKTRYETEKKKIEQDARELEHQRDINQAKDPYFDYAEVLLQISIVMASVSILAMSPQIFYFALAAAGFGTVFMLNGYLLLFRIPFFH
jgi:hypothetical protein